MQDFTFEQFLEQKQRMQERAQSIKELEHIKEKASNNMVKNLANALIKHEMWGDIYEDLKRCRQMPPIKPTYTVIATIKNKRGGAIEVRESKASGKQYAVKTI